MNNLLTKKSLKIDILLLLLYFVGILFFFKDNLLTIIFIFMWLPGYYIFKYSDVLEKDGVGPFVNPTNIREFEESFIKLSFGTPFIGPIIAILRINYLENKIAEREKAEEDTRKTEILKKAEEKKKPEKKPKEKKYD